MLMSVDHFRQAPVMTPHIAPAPEATSAEVRQRMQVQRRRDTSCEMAIRSLLHAAGFRYRVDARPLADWRRRADLVFPRARTAVFIDGCFWHGCPDHGAAPKSNAAWWQAKIARNRERDAETDARLRAAGWIVLRIWEHENPMDAAARVADVVRERRGGQ
jgi:DNA mismatch endonuclease (patch repair protein)